MPLHTTLARERDSVWKKKEKENRSNGCANNNLDMTTAVTPDAVLRADLCLVQLSVVAILKL